MGGQARGRGRPRKSPATKEGHFSGDLDKVHLLSPEPPSSAENRTPENQSTPTKAALETTEASSSATTSRDDVFKPEEGTGIPQAAASAPAGGVQTWASLFSANRGQAKGMGLTYYPPSIVDGKPVVLIDESEVKQLKSQWMHAIIVYCIGERPGFKHMQNFIKSKWEVSAEPQFFLHDEGYFVVKFQNQSDKDRILSSGPYFINNKPLILKNWVNNFDFKAEFHKDIPIWVTLPNLPVSFWGKNTLGRIASFIGTPLYADECTALQSRISYARILVEVNVNKSLPELIAIKDEEGTVYDQKIDSPLILLLQSATSAGALVPIITTFPF